MDGKIGRITTSGSVTHFPLPSASGPQGITAGPDQNIWFASGGDAIGRITALGVLTQLALPTKGSRPVHVTTASDGNLWFTEQLGNNIGHVTP